MVLGDPTNEHDMEKTMNKRILGVLAVGLAFSGAGMAASTTAQANDNQPIVASDSGKETFCRSKFRFTNTLSMTIQLEKLRVTSATDPAFFQEFSFNGSSYRPVAGATVSTPVMDVKVPTGHKYKWKVVFRTQVTAGKNPTWSALKTMESGAGAIQPACALDGATFGLNVREDN
jgi:hypothetical protein